ncbi:unnamed protein product [Orchesella dallaii]|uniref:Ion transport domain-containing protein n=1 Tax=Orchesella dallaii TaxID=48710 RepID=A0ABP1R9U2_9HEXA
MGKKEKKDKKKKGKKSKSATQNASFTSVGRRGSNSSSTYGAVPVQGSGSDTDTSIQNQPSPIRRLSPSPVMAPLSSLDPEEYEFFSMVKSGDAQGVTRYLSSPEFARKGKNINRFNINGYTALHMAVRRQDEEMIHILLKTPNIQLYDTILHSVREDNLDITKLLLEINDKLMQEEGTLPTLAIPDDEDNKARPISSQSGISTSLRPINGIIRTSVTGLNDSGIRTTSTNSPTVTAGPSTRLKKDRRDDIPFDSEFHQVITPLMLAAQVGSTQLIDLFYKRGERLETLKFHHNLGCECEICAKLDGDGDMTRVHQRYHLYKAICQPEYICFMAQKMKKDPVNYAIDKIVKIRDIMKKDKAYDQMYTDFIKELEKYCVDMLSMCRTTLETTVFLSPKDTEEKKRLPHQHPRLWYTMGLNMKSFVAHANTQNTDWPAWETYGIIYRIFNLAIRVVAFPLIAIILFMAEGSNLAKTLGSPIGRFLNYVASYFVFLALVVIQVAFPYQRCNDVEPYYKINDNICKKRGAPNIGTEWPIIIYIFSFIASMLKRQSVSWYWRMKWNWYDVLFILSFLCTFACWLSAWMWTQMPENEPLISALDRLVWDPYSPEVLGECFLAIATMLAGWRLLRFIQIFEIIGPLQVIFGKQIAAFISTTAMFFGVLFAFASAMLAVYVPYKNYQGLNDHKEHKSQDDTFCDPYSAVPHLFSHLIDAGAAGSLLTWEIKLNETTVEEVHHYYTQTTGKIIIIIYHVIGVLMMYNMLTGYFGQTMGDILKDSDRIWKFARTELYLIHTKDTILPPPFNLIPTLKTLQNGMKYFTLIGKKDDPKAACSFRQCCYITASAKGDEWKKLRMMYRDLILELIFRYYKFRSDSQDKEQASRDDVLEIGEEITELKEKLRIDGKVGHQDNDDDDDSEDEDFNNFPRRPPSEPPSNWRKLQGRADDIGNTQSNVNPSASAAGGGGNTQSSPVLRAQPQGSNSPQPGPSGTQRFNASPVSKPPIIPKTPPSAHTTPPPKPPTRYSFSKPSSPPMNLGLFESGASVKANPTVQMVNYQTPPHKGNQQSYTVVRTESSSLMQLPPQSPKTNQPIKTNSKVGDLNRNESDSLYGSTTVANVAQMPLYNNNRNDRFSWMDSAHFPPPARQEKTAGFKGRLSNSDTWDQSALTKFPPPVARANMKQRGDDFGSPVIGGSGEPTLPQPLSFKGRLSNSDTWDQTPLLKYPPTIVRENMREMREDFGSLGLSGSGALTKVNPRDSNTWNKTPLQECPPPVVRENFKERANDFGEINKGVPFVKPNPRDSNTWDKSPLYNFPPPIVRETLKQRADDFGRVISSSAAVKPNPRDSSTWDKTPISKFPPPVVRDNLKKMVDDFEGGRTDAMKPNPRDSSTWDKTPVLNFPPPIVRENMKEQTDDFGSLSRGSSGESMEPNPRDSETWDES